MQRKCGELMMVKSQLLSVETERAELMEQLNTQKNNVDRLLRPSDRHAAPVS